MKDELSIITEMISGATKLLYANKRRQLKGLPPLTPEEEKEYTGVPSPVKAAYLKISKNGTKWEAYSKPEMSVLDIPSYIDSDSFAAILIYKLVKNHYTDIYIRYGAADDGSIEHLSKERLDAYYKQGEKRLNRQRMSSNK